METAATDAAKVTKVSKAQKRLLRLLACYDSELVFETSDGNEIRSLRALARAGLIVAEEYIDDPGRWLAYRKES